MTGLTASATVQITVDGITDDTTPPTIISSSISSNNPNSNAFARDGDNVSLVLTTDEPIQPPSVSFNGLLVPSIIETGPLDGTTWIASQLITSSDPEGPIRLRLLL